MALCALVLLYREMGKRNTVLPPHISGVALLILLLKKVPDLLSDFGSETFQCEMPCVV